MRPDHPIAVCNLYDSGILMQTGVRKKYTRGEMADFVVYYRVSTDWQGVTGLGLDAQRASVQRFLASGQAPSSPRSTADAAPTKSSEAGRRSARSWYRLEPCRQCWAWLSSISSENHHANQT
jgi:hypothetical protein